MTKAEFIEGYAARSGWTVERLLTHYVALPCACDYENCHGWQLESKRRIRDLAEIFGSGGIEELMIGLRCWDREAIREVLDDLELVVPEMVAG